MTSPLDSFLEDVGADLRDEDLRILKALVEDAPRRREDGLFEGPGPQGLSETEADAFDDMLSRLQDEGQPRLTDRQREWATRRYHELELSDPAERNRNVPRGREVCMAPVLHDLPKRPPGRR